MTYNIVGDWKEFTFQMVTTRDAENICAFVQNHYFKDELMNALHGWCDNKEDDYDRLLYGALSHEMSFVAVKKNTQELAGINLLTSGKDPGDAITKFLPMSDICKNISSVLTKLDEISTEAFRTQFHSENHAEIFLTSIAKPFTGHGLCTEMYRRSLKYLKAKQIQTVKSEFSSPKTRAIGDKLGFLEIGRLYFNSHVNGNGEKVFPSAGPDDFIAFMVKNL